jgi:hypothetical protein
MTWRDRFFRSHKDMPIQTDWYARARAILNREWDPRHLPPEPNG